MAENVEGLGRYGAQLTTPKLVMLDMLAVSRQDAIAQLAHLLYQEQRVANLQGFLQQVNAREHQLATGLPGGIGLPHARSEYVASTSIAVGITKYGHALDFGAKDGLADIVLLIGTPARSFSEHLEVLATLARLLFQESFRQSLRRASDAEQLAELLNSSLVFFPH